MTQMTLVSFYGSKSSAFTQLLQDCIGFIQASPLQSIFEPYPIAQIHGTIVGMEKITGYQQVFNANAWEKEKTKVEMDFGPLIPSLQAALSTPLPIQFGGFAPKFDTFQSFGRLPYERSFQIQWASKRFTLIGWPHRQGQFAGQYLNQLRQLLYTNCNIQHKWGADNDLFMVIGKIGNLESFSAKEIELLKKEAIHLEKKVRDYLTYNKLELLLDLQELYLVQYKETSLSLATSVTYPITDSRLEAAFIKGLYR